ncbi:hypothetical protein HBI84_197510 [Parastagonospora nodorum]|nr:hypothetical protein HBI84_197510 [Parastagonospora nodorum]
MLKTIIFTKELKLTLNILLLGSNKSLLFLALAYLKNLRLSSEELLALVILVKALSNSTQSLLTLIPISILKSIYISKMQRGNK